MDNNDNNNDYETSQVININAEDIEDNLNNILENSNTFKKNSNIDVIRCIIFYVDGKNVMSYKKYEKHPAKPADQHTVSDNNSALLIVGGKLGPNGAPRNCEKRKADAKGYCRYKHPCRQVIAIKALGW